MEREIWAPRTAFTRPCLHWGCKFVFKYDLPEEMLALMERHNEKEHSGALPGQVHLAPPFERLGGPRYTHKCTHKHCSFMSSGSDVPHMIRIVWQHNEEAHASEFWPDRLELTEYDERFLRGLRISVPT